MGQNQTSAKQELPIVASYVQQSAEQPLPPAPIPSPTTVVQVAQTSADQLPSGMTSIVVPIAAAPTLQSIATSVDWSRPFTVSAKNVSQEAITTTAPAFWRSRNIIIMIIIIIAIVIGIIGYRYFFKPAVSALIVGKGHRR